MAEFFLLEVSMVRVSGHGSPSADPRAGLERCKPLIRCRAALRPAKNVSVYQSTIVVADEQRDEAAERQERPERDRSLARLGPVAGDQARP